MQYTDRLSPHWVLAELCRPSDWLSLANDTVAQERLVQLVLTVLEPLRALWGAPVLCVSGYRSPEHNARVGGAQASQHMLGRAADIVPADLPWVAMRAGHGTDAQAARLDKFTSLIEHHMSRELEAIGGIGRYLGWTHVDTRPRGTIGHVARWEGKDFGSEVA